jgi:hypothetical protein
VQFPVDDATTEAVTEILEQNPCGVLLAQDELAGFFGGFDTYRSGGSGKDLFIPAVRVERGAGSLQPQDGAKTHFGGNPFGGDMRRDSTGDVAKNILRKRA